MEKKATKALKPGQERVAGRMAGTIMYLQSRWSSWMGNRFERLSDKWKKIAVGCFCFLSCSVCCWLVLTGVMGVKSGKSAIAPIAVPFQQPRATLKQGQLNGAAEKGSREDVQPLLRLLDSMERTTDGKQKMDSLKRHRPGLVDSIRTWLQLNGRGDRSSLE